MRRSLQRLLEQSRWRWVTTNDGLNRHERRKYLAQLRKAGAKARREKEQFVRYVLNLEHVS